MLAQCKKRDLHFKMAALEATGNVLHDLKVDCFAEIFALVLEIVKPVSVREL